MLFSCLLLTSKLTGQTQDSIKLEVTRARSDQDKTYYWLRDAEKNRYFTICSCVQKHKKGDFVMIARKDFEIIAEKVTRKTLFK